MVLFVNVNFNSNYWVFLGFNGWAFEDGPVGEFVGAVVFAGGGGGVVGGVVGGGESVGFVDEAADEV